MRNVFLYHFLESVAAISNRLRKLFEEGTTCMIDEVLVLLAANPHALSVLSSSEFDQLKKYFTPCGDPVLSCLSALFDFECEFMQEADADQGAHQANPLSEQWHQLLQNSVNTNITKAVIHQRLYQALMSALGDYYDQLPEPAGELAPDQKVVKSTPRFRVVPGATNINGWTLMLYDCDKKNAFDVCLLSPAEWGMGKNAKLCCQSSDTAMSQLWVQFYSKSYDGVVYDRLIHDPVQPSRSVSGDLRKELRVLVKDEIPQALQGLDYHVVDTLGLPDLAGFTIYYKPTNDNLIIIEKNTGCVIARYNANRQSFISSDSWISSIIPPKSFRVFDDVCLIRIGGHWVLNCCVYEKDVSQLPEWATRKHYVDFFRVQLTPCELALLTDRVLTSQEVGIGDTLRLNLCDSRKTAKKAIYRITKFNGKSVAAIEASMQPGQDSTPGFLAPGDKLLQVIFANFCMFQELSVTPELVKALLHYLKSSGPMCYFLGRWYARRDDFFIVKQRGYDWRRNYSAIELVSHPFYLPGQDYPTEGMDIIQDIVFTNKLPDPSTQIHSIDQLKQDGVAVIPVSTFSILLLNFCFLQSGPYQLNLKQFMEAAVGVNLVSHEAAAAARLLSAPVSNLFQRDNPSQQSEIRKQDTNSCVIL